MNYTISTSNKFNEALHYFDMGRYEQALNILNELLEEEPNNGRALYIISWCYYKLENHQEAIKHCYDSLEKGFSVAECNYLLGEIYMSDEEYVKAEQSFLEALRSNPEKASVLAAYGMLMLKTGHEKKAKQLMDEAMRINPEDETVVHYNLMYYLVRNKRKDQIGMLERYMQSASDEVMKLIHLGIYNMHNNNFKEARENFRQAFLLDPKNKEILHILEALDKECNIIFLPRRLVAKVGVAGLWISVIVITIILECLGLKSLQDCVVTFYLVFAVYTWIAPIIYRLVSRSKFRF